MKQTIKNSALILMLICASSTGLMAQTFCLQLTEVSNDGTNLIIDISMSGDVAFGLGTSNLQFEGTTGAFGPAALVSSPLAPPTYQVPTVTQPLADANSFNLELVFPGTGAIVPVNPGTLLIGQVSLPILNAGLAADGLTWSYTGSTTQTVVFLDDDSTQLFATDPNCLVGNVVAAADIRLLTVNQDLKEITFKNFGGSDQDISNWRLCSNFNYTFTGMDGDAAITIIAGDYNLSAGEEMTVAWTPGGGFRAAGDDIGIYLAAGGFGDPLAMVDFMQYLSPGNGRESVAVSKGIWGTAEFVTGGSPYSFTGAGGDTGLAFWSGLIAVDGCTDAAAANYNPAATNDDGTCLYDVTFNVDMNCETGFIEPALEGPLFGWCGGCVPLTDPDLDGIWSVTVQIPLGDFEYKYAVDAFASQENLIDDMVNGGTCAPVTDFANFANRLIPVSAGLVVNDTYGTCGICDPTDIEGCTDINANNYNPLAMTDNGSCLYDVIFNVDLSCYDGTDPDIDVNTPGSFTTIALEGPSLGWCGSCVTLVDDGAGIWSVTLSLPAGPFEYKYAHDVFAGQEQLVDDMTNGGICAPITDTATFANRQIDVPITLMTNDTYGSCDSCAPDCPTDLDGNGSTNGDDFSIFLGNYGLACSMNPCATDFDGSGTTNGDDFSIFLGNFGLPCN
ncbi:MAG: hypothetical protein ACI9AT_002072 [Ulvibacter sp.]|jgi:hypothetical protein